MEIRKTTWRCKENGGSAGQCCCSRLTYFTGRSVVDEIKLEEVSPLCDVEVGQARVHRHLGPRQCAIGDPTERGGGGQAVRVHHEWVIVH